MRLPETKTIAIIPEGHTKNTFYLDHLHALMNAIEAAGYRVILATPDKTLFPNGEFSLELISHSQQKIVFYQGLFSRGEFYVQTSSTSNEKIDLIILNNDQSSPLDVLWNEIKTPVCPSPLMGWFRRQKNIYFTHYEAVCKNFAEHFSINPELLFAQYETVEKVDFSTKEGLSELANKANALKQRLPEPTPLFIKPSQGTYGMGITVVSSGDDILNMNRRDRNKMDIGKNRIKFTSVLLQEGIETAITYDGAPAEITIYLIGGESIGGFMRANPEKTNISNLNSKGMVFEKFCFSEIEQNADHRLQEMIYSVIARLANIASGYEIKESLANQN